MLRAYFQQKFRPSCSVLHLALVAHSTDLVCTGPWSPLPSSSPIPNYAPWARIVSKLEPVIEVPCLESKGRFLAFGSSTSTKDPRITRQRRSISLEDAWGHRRPMDVLGWDWNSGGRGDAAIQTLEVSSPKPKRRLRNRLIGRLLIIIMKTWNINGMKDKPWNEWSEGVGALVHY